MFNCYVVLAGPDKVTDAGSATTCRRKLKAPSLQTKCGKNEGPSENEFHGKTVGSFQTKNTLLASTKQPRKTHGPKMQLLKRDLVTRKKRTEGKLKQERSIQIKTVGT